MPLKYELPGFPPSLKKHLTPYLNVFFGQYCEDVVLSDMLIDGIIPKKGFYVDMGAFHPLEKSNTALLNIFGWQGMNIDANPDVISLFKQVRPDDINLCCGIAAEEGVMKYHTFHQNGVNTFSAEHAATVQKKGAVLKEIIEIPCREVNEILQTELPPNQHIDVLNIDLEGMDTTILYALDWSVYLPSILLFEITVSDIETHFHSDVHRFIKEKGYTLISALGLTVIYSRVS